MVNSPRKSPRLNRCCPQCVLVESTGPIETDYTRQKLLLANRLGVSEDQIELSAEGARLLLFQVDVIRLIKR